MTYCAAILAGGPGTRLKPAAGDKPKVLATVAGRPFIFFLLDWLEKAGVKLCVLCTGIGHEQIESALSGWYGEMKLVYSREDSRLGTGGALRLALPLFNSKTVLALNGDSFCSISLKSFFTWHEENNAEASLVLTPSKEPERFGRITFGPKDKIRSFTEKSSETAPGWINAGIYLLPKTLIESIPLNREVSLERSLFPAWTHLNLLSGFKAGGNFIDIGTPESYHQAQTFFNAGARQ